jgi:hypothetical protein
MTLVQLKEWINIQITKHPEYKEEILDYYDLCINEIEEGGSATHEIELCRDSIEQLTEEEVND